VAQLVFAAAVPHTPYFPRAAQEGGSSSRVTLSFQQVKSYLDRAAPDLLISLASDHFVAFFFDNMPTFCVGVVDAASGPYENSRDDPFMPWYEVKVNRAFAAAFLEYGLEAGFDLASSEELRLDHATLVPLHFLTPRMDVPIVPLFIKGLAQPLPTASRCYAFGELLRRFMDRWPGPERIGIVASGSLSLDVGSPRMGRVDHEWLDTVVALVRDGNAAELVRRATPQRFLAAGNTGGEILNWIALLGAVGARRPAFIEPDIQPPEAPRDAHAYAVWTMDGTA
jgi:protocatechuate 4,5-dioxygenase beta chain